MSRCQLNKWSYKVDLITGVMGPPLLGVPITPVYNWLGPALHKPWAYIFFWNSRNHKSMTLCSVVFQCFVSSNLTRESELYKAMGPPVSSWMGEKLHLIPAFVGSISLIYQGSNCLVVVHFSYKVGCKPGTNAALYPL